MMSILFIDDDLDDLELYSEAVKSIGSDFRFIMTTNGDEGLSMLKRSPADVVFLDINMPGTDGKTVLKTIRRDRSLDPVKVCILSTSISADDCAMYKRMGANHCLQKASSFDELKRTMLSVLTKNLEARQR